MATAFILSAVFLLLCGYFGTNTPVAITFLTVAVGIGGLNFGGFNVNHLDIGAAHAGVLMGLTNMFATIPGFIGPQIAKLIAATVSFRYIRNTRVAVYPDSLLVVVADESH